MKMDNNNPYVGLRPFETDESILFFGRNEQTLELLQRLHKHHFVAVVGSSGCGKSSLLRAGLIPSLKAGYLIDDSDHWFIAIMKPGKNPLYNLADSILRQVNPAITEDEVSAFVQKINESGSDVILDLIAPIEQEKNINFFLLVDQFEELFRFTMDQTDANKKDEAIDFVNIMLELSQQKNIPFFVVLTMRSDFIGDCTQFHGLPETLNKSQYLVPRLNRMEMKMAIEGPAKLYGGKFNPALTSRLLNELGKVKDELPLLQHALMRMWDFEKDADKNGQIDLHDYDKIGGIEKALNNHADEAFDGLNENEQLIARKMFQALTAIDENGRKIRRPALLSQLKELTGAREEQLLKIIAQFIEDRRSFLVINKDGSTGERIIDISHESLIRQWNTLNKWVDEEGESVSDYLRLADAAELHKQNRKDLLTGSEFQLALDWYNKYNPTAIWGNRYKPGFADAVQYLKDSEMEKVRMMNYEIARSRKQKRLVAAVIALLAFSAIGGGYFSVSLKNKNKEIWGALETAKIARKSAELSAKQAETERDNAKKALIAEETARESEQEANQQRLVALNAAQQSEEAAVKAKEAAIKSAKKLEASDSAFKLHVVAQEVVAKDPTLALRLEEEAFEKYPIPYFEESLEKIYTENTFYKRTFYKKYINENDDESDGTFSKNEAFFSQDGKHIIFYAPFETTMWDLSGNRVPGYNSRKGEILDDDYKPIIFSSNVSNKTFINALQERKSNYYFINYFPSTALISPDGKIVLTAAGKNIRLWDESKNSYIDFMGHDSTVNSIAFSPIDGKILTGSEDKTVRLWNLKGDTLRARFNCPNKVTSVAFSPNGTKIAICTYKTVQLWDLTTNKQINLSGHSDEVLSAIFSPDGNTILTSSKDQTVRTWKPNGQPLEIFKIPTEDISIAFSPDGRSFVTGSKKGPVRLWDLNCLPFQKQIAQYRDTIFYDYPGRSIKWLESNSGSGKEIKFNEEIKTIRYVRITPDRNRIVIAIDTTKYYSWDLQQNKLIKLEQLTRDGESASAVSPDSKFLSFGYWNATARIWNLTKDTASILFQGHTALIKGVAFSPNSKMFLTGSGDATARLWDMNGNLLEEFKHPGEVASVTFSPDGKNILTSSYDRNVRLWDINGKLIRVFDEPWDVIWGLSFSPDGKKILNFCPATNTTHLWDIYGKSLAIVKGNQVFHKTQSNELVLTTPGNSYYWSIPLPLETFLKSDKLAALKPGENE